MRKRIHQREIIWSIFVIYVGIGTWQVVPCVVGYRFPSLYCFDIFVSLVLRQLWVLHAGSYTPRLKNLFLSHLSYLQQRWSIVPLDHCVTENNRVTFQVPFFMKTLNQFAHLTTLFWHQSNRGKLHPYKWTPGCPIHYPNCRNALRSVECHVFFLLEQFRSKMAAGKRSTCRSSRLNSFCCFWPFFLIFFKSQEPVYLSHQESSPEERGMPLFWRLQLERGTIWYGTVSAVTTYITLTVTQVQTLLTGVEMLLKNLSEIIIILKFKSPLNQSDSRVVVLVLWTWLIYAKFWLFLISY